MEQQLGLSGIGYSLEKKNLSFSLGKNYQARAESSKYHLSRFS